MKEDKAKERAAKIEAKSEECDAKWTAATVAR